MKKSIVLIGLLAAVSVFAIGCGSTGKKTEEADYSKFAGDWYVDGSLDNGHLSIDKNGHVESYSYEDTVNYEGELKREEYENPDGSVGYLYSIYDGSEFIIGFYEPEEEDFYELYSGQDGEIHFVRSDHCTD